MKKMVALALAITMLMSLAGVASAAPFGIPVWCNSTTNYTKADEAGEQKSGTQAAIYVYHHDNVDTDEYTNHFRGIEVKTNTTRGSFYTVSARGNTNYYNNDGISRITLNGRYDVNK